MKRRIPVFIMFFVVSCALGFAQVFYLAVVQAQEAFPDQAFQLRHFLKNQYTGAEKIVVCSGNTQVTTLFSLYSQIFSPTSNQTPWEALFEMLEIEAVFPTRKDLAGGVSPMSQSLPAFVKIVATDREESSGLPLYYARNIGKKNVLFANITEVPSNWYERLRKEVNFLSYDAIVLVVDNPDFRIVPESLRSKTMVIPRKTAIYRVDLEYGLLITEMKIPLEKEVPDSLKTLTEDFSRWTEQAFPIDPEGKCFLYEIPFFSMMGIMMNNLFPMDLAIFCQRSLPLQATPQETISFFEKDVFGTLYLDNASIRKLLERSASALDIVDGEILFRSPADFFSLWGEPYFLDLTKPKGERLILRTFDKSQRIGFFGPRELLEKTVPGIKILDISPLPYVFWAMKYGAVHLDPAWQALTQPYFIDYVIQKGDTLISIANAYGVTVEEIKQYNPGLIDMYLLPGAALKIHLPIGD
ncbi:MAG TPA: LysM domain-containing protein [Thermotogota bacterium]|nr:LysM domain-containing protein [Thermotogota bacterium]HQQ66558.1 LysM domain-containing protein [Thermotogota bacterium]